MESYNKIPLWKDIKSEEWKNWKWQLQNVITTKEQLSQIIELNNDEKNGIEKATEYLQMKISPHIALLIKEQGIETTLKKQFVPSEKEIESIEDDKLYDDVNADDRYSPMPNLVHRYPTKVLLFPSNYCGCYCRYCFRRKLARYKEVLINKEEYEKIFEYLKNNKQIDEVILSGGDPLVINDEHLEFIVSNLAKIPSIKIFRIHTRMPITIPYRITDNLINMLKKYKKYFPIYFVIHIDTKNEISEETKEVIEKLVDNGFMCLAQCPLLKGINDSEDSLKDLWTELVRLRVKPYYLFHSDPVKGLGHFVVSLERGLEINKNLFDKMSGLAMPLYCFNVPNGGGHILLTYPYVKKIDEGHYELTTFEGDTTKYYEYKEDI